MEARAPLNLPDLIRALSTDFGEVDSRKLADRIMSSLTPSQQREALASILPDYIRRVLGRAWPNPVEDVPLPSADEPPLRQVGRHRGQRVREAYYAELQRVFVTEDGPKQYRDLTVDDLEYLAGDREKQAASLLQAAEEFRKAAALLKRHRKQTVGDLSSAAYAQLFGSQA